MQKNIKHNDVNHQDAVKKANDYIKRILTGEVMDKIHVDVKSEVTNLPYEALEATEALKEKVPVFITGNFDEGTASTHYECILSAAGGRVLKIEKKEDFKPIKEAIDLYKQTNSEKN